LVDLHDGGDTPLGHEGDVRAGRGGHDRDKARDVEAPVIGGRVAEHADLGIALDAEPARWPPEDRFAAQLETVHSIEAFRREEIGGRSRQRRRSKDSLVEVDVAVAGQDRQDARYHLLTDVDFDTRQVRILSSRNRVGGASGRNRGRKLNECQAACRVRARAG